MTPPVDWYNNWSTLGSEQRWWVALKHCWSSRHFRRTFHPGLSRTLILSKKSSPHRSVIWSSSIQDLLINAFKFFRFNYLSLCLDISISKWTVWSLSNKSRLSHIAYTLVTEFRFQFTISTVIMENLLCVRTLPVMQILKKDCIQDATKKWNHFSRFRYLRRAFILYVRPISDHYICLESESMGYLTDCLEKLQCNFSNWTSTVAFTKNQLLKNVLTHI